MPIFNQQPTPRLLVINCEEEELVDAHLEKYFPTIKYIDGYDLGDIEQSEYDVAIVFEEDRSLGLADHLHIVSIGGAVQSLHKQEDGSLITPMIYPNSSVATSFDIDSTLDHPLYKLSLETLLPVFKGQQKHDVLGGSRRVSSIISRPENVWQPLIKDGNGKTLSGFFSRTAKQQPELWYLPPSLSISDIGRWLKLLTERWAVINPNVFGSKGSWKSDKKWASSDEDRINEAIQLEKSNFRAAKDTHNKSLEKLQQALDKAREESDKNYRILLTGQANVLKNSVSSVLKKLGFRVTDSDATAKPGDLLEDLQVHTDVGDKSPAAWIGLVEVRSYSKGAQLNDFLRLSRFSARYQKEHGGEPPDAVWYIVNHSLALPPDKRDKALINHKPEVKEFEESINALVIDTTDLLQLTLEVDKGIITQEIARERLINQKGYFKL